MKSLNIDTVNFKRLLINGKEFYSTTGRTILNTLFLGDEVITLTSSDFVNGIYETNRTDLEDPIRKYTISTTDAIVNITVTKVDNIHFTINSVLDKLYKVDYISIGTVPYIIKYRDYAAGVWTYTLDRTISTNYTTVVPVYTIGAYDKDDAYLTPSLIKVDTNVKVYYKDVYTNDDSIRYLKLYDNVSYGSKVTDGMVGEFDFDGSLINNVNSVLATGVGAFSYQSARTGKGTSLKSGTTAMINLGNLHQSSNVMTFSAWILKNTVTSTTLFSVGNYNVIMSTNGYITITTKNSDNYTLSSSVFSSGWHHLTVVCDPTSSNGYGDIYIDGIKMTPTKTGTRATSVTIANNPILLFGDATVTSHNVGNIDEIKIFNRALTELEVYQLYTSTSQTYVDNIKIDLFTQRNINKLTNIEWETLSNDYKISVENTKIVSDGSIIIDNQVVELDTSIIEITSI